MFPWRTARAPSRSLYLSPFRRCAAAAAAAAAGCCCLRSLWSLVVGVKKLKRQTRGREKKMLPKFLRFSDFFHFVLFFISEFFRLLLRHPPDRFFFFFLATGTKVSTSTWYCMCIYVCGSRPRCVCRLCSRVRTLRSAQL